FRERQEAGVCERAKELRLRVVKDRPSSQRIELLQGLDVRRRLEAVDRGQQKLVRTRGEFLKRRQRVRTRGEALRLEYRTRHAGHPGDAVVRRPLRTPAGPSRGDGSFQRVVQTQQVVRMSTNRGLRIHLQQLS